MAVARAPGQIVTLGLGSCIAICAYDKMLQIGGMAHIMLPSSLLSQDTIHPNPAKFADLAVPCLIGRMEELGSVRSRIDVKMVGGAEMFLVADRDEHYSVGKRNIIATENACRELGLIISAKSVGGNIGKSVTLDLTTGEVHVKTLTTQEIL
ncbi:MAG: chemotaxis protein CheD [Firmicutes bacterium]|nr:chemotaxis protein CheD [Bacillota bacterium]